jgi:hypothetical protein
MAAAGASRESEEQHPGTALRPAALFAVAGATIAVLTGIAGGRHLGYRWDDAFWYYRMAAGQTRTVAQPFASRPLTPLLVRNLDLATHLGLNRSFFVVEIVSIALFAMGLCWMLVHLRARNGAIAAVCLLGFWAIAVSNYMLPDGLNALLLLIFIILLLQERFLWAACMLLPLTISRESSVLVLLCFAVAVGRRASPRVLLTGVAGTVAGMGVVRILTSGGAGNRHGLGGLAYLVLKAPLNFSANILGIEPWTNTLQSVCTPAWSAPLGFHLGAISRIGLCSWQPISPLTVIGAYACEFGFLPALFLCACEWNGRKMWSTQPPWLRFCLLYGTACLLLAPLLGSTIDRLVSYSWPLFVVAVPVLIKDCGERIPWAFVAATGAVSSWVFFLAEAGQHTGLLAVVTAGTLAAEAVLITRLRALHGRATGVGIAE